MDINVPVVKSNIGGSDKLIDTICDGFKAGLEDPVMRKFLIGCAAAGCLYLVYCYGEKIKRGIKIWKQKIRKPFQIRLADFFDITCSRI